MDYSPPGSSVHGISQARILEWVTMSSSRGSSWSRGRTQVSCITGRYFTIWATREALTAIIPAQFQSEKWPGLDSNDMITLYLIYCLLSFIAHCSSLFLHSYVLSSLIELKAFDGVLTVLTSSFFCLNSPFCLCLADSYHPGLRVKLLYRGVFFEPPRLCQVPLPSYSHIILHPSSCLTVFTTC